MKDKVVLVTGAASGIGLVSAQFFAREGAKVMLSDVNDAAGEAAAEDIRKQGAEAAYVSCDVSQAEQVEAMVKACVSTFGRLDIAINNAGIGGAWARTGDYPLEDYHRVMAINVDGVFFGMKYQLPQMVAQGGGAIVNISSIAGLRGLSFNGPYTASKHAVIGLTKAASIEYASQNIRINAICPVFTQTPILDPILALDERTEDRLKKNIPMRRFGKPEEIADAILWVCSEKATFITGQAYPIDGGFTSS